MDANSIIMLLKRHIGKVVGVIIGLFFGILILRIGFWASILLCLCIALGVYIGGMHDRGERIAGFLEKIRGSNSKNE